MMNDKPEKKPIEPGRHLPAQEMRRFILANTAPITPPHVPEITLQLAHEAFELWSRTEDEMEEFGLPPPFWAFAWAGGQGLARYVIDNPSVACGKKVLDFASGSGLVAIAAAKAGATRIEASDIDPYSLEAIALNAERNDASLSITGEDLIGTTGGWNVVLAGDVFYDRVLATLVTDWFSNLAGRGATVLIGDPGRAYLPREGLTLKATYDVPVTRALEDAEVKRTSVWQFS
jgi:predicted nicotinamide N-methyase